MSITDAIITVAAIRAADPQGARLTVAEGDVALARLSQADAERDTLAAKPSRTASEDARLAALPMLRQLQRLGEEFSEDDLLRLRQLPRQIDYEFDQLQTVASHAG